MRSPGALYSLGDDGVCCAAFARRIVRMRTSGCACRLVCYKLLMEWVAAKQTKASKPIYLHCLHAIKYTHTLWYIFAVCLCFFFVRFVIRKVFGTKSELKFPVDFQRVRTQFIHIADTSMCSLRSLTAKRYKSTRRRLGGTRTHNKLI